MRGRGGGGDGVHLFPINKRPSYVYIYIYIDRSHEPQSYLTTNSAGNKTNKYQEIETNKWYITNKCVPFVVEVDLLVYSGSGRFRKIT